jgi:hypothetical protein
MVTPDYLEAVEPPPPLLPTTSLLTGIPPITDDSRWERGVRHIAGRGPGPFAPDDPGAPTDVTITDLVCATTESVSLVLVASCGRRSRRGLVSAATTSGSRRRGRTWSGAGRSSSPAS